MRLRAVLLMVAVLPSCAPPHRTHPSKVDCLLEVETRFSARVDNTPPGTARPSPDPCQGPTAGVSEWTQRGASTVSVCAAAGTTPEQAASLCSRHLEATGRSVGTGAPPPAPHPPFGRICAGSVNVLSSQIVGTGGTPAVQPNQCREGTTWPLLP